MVWNISTGWLGLAAWLCTVLVLAAAGNKSATLLPFPRRRAEENEKKKAETSG